MQKIQFRNSFDVIYGLYVKGSLVEEWIRKLFRDQIE